MPVVASGSRASVRIAVSAWFAPPNVAGLNTLYTAWPKKVYWPDYVAGQLPGTLSGAAGVVWVGPGHERRASVGGPTSGWKRIDYDVELQLILHSTRAKAEDAVADYDALIDAALTRLRSDRTLGSPNVWQAGEGDTWPDAGTEQQTTDGGVDVWGAIHFQVSQWLQT